MATYNSSGANLWQQQSPYLYNSAYDNYLGNHVNINNNQLNQYLKCRPVSSREEAMACQIDLDGSLWVFTDLSHKNIYTKQIGNDGTAIFKMYSFVENKNIEDTDFITREEFNQAIKTIAAAMPRKSSNEITIKDNSSNTLLDFS